ncbi:LysR substrate-binding domain-containing protein [Delftia sp. Cs1-4]|uniref:LysR substrate-binding domain-containing protein n=1 Tax=Delftia sp. (strain Cs1-4) TaxID=742013 RepID=UPI0002F43F34|nr:LysR substrate-binding domain-containing protein [Delftia sp. Cs1-4]
MLSLQPTDQSAQDQIRHLTSKYTRFLTSVHKNLSSAMQDQLLQGGIDLAVLYDARPVQGLDVQPLLDQALLLVGRRPPGLQEDPPPPPLTLAEVARLPLVIPSRPNAIRMYVESEMACVGCVPCVSLEIDGVGAMLDLVADGAGFAILPRSAVTRSLNPSAYTLRDIASPALRIPVFTAASAQRRATLTQQATLELIRKTAQMLFMD